MAKKKAAAKKPAAAAKASPGLGKKFCPHCNATIAARSVVCPECEKPIPPKNGSKKPAKKKAAPAASSNGVDPIGIIVKAQELATAAGGYKKAVAVLQAIADGYEVGNG